MAAKKAKTLKALQSVWLSFSPLSTLNNTPPFLTAAVPTARPTEKDEKRLAARQKQLDFGKNTLGYARYCEYVPRHARRREHPRTPDKFQVCSKRSWDGQVRKWRRLLHEWDPVGSTEVAAEKASSAAAAAEKTASDAEDADAAHSEHTPKKKAKMAELDDGSRSCFADEASRHPLPEVAQQQSDERSRLFDEETRTTAAVREELGRTSFAGLFGGRSWADVAEDGDDADDEEIARFVAQTEQKEGQEQVHETATTSTAARSKRPRAAV